MFTTEEVQLLLNDINEGMKRDGLVNAAPRLNIVVKLQTEVKLQAETAARIANPPSPEKTPCKAPPPTPKTKG